MPDPAPKDGPIEDHPDLRAVDFEEQGGAPDGLTPIPRVVPDAEAPCAVQPANSRPASVRPSSTGPALTQPTGLRITSGVVTGPRPSPSGPTVTQESTVRASGSQPATTRVSNPVIAGAGASGAVLALPNLSTGSGVLHPLAPATGRPAAVQPSNDTVTAARAAEVQAGAGKPGAHQPATASPCGSRESTARPSGAPPAATSYSTAAPSRSSPASTRPASTRNSATEPAPEMPAAAGTGAALAATNQPATCLPDGNPATASRASGTQPTAHQPSASAPSVARPASTTTTAGERTVTVVPANAEVASAIPSPAAPVVAGKSLTPNQSWLLTETTRLGNPSPASGHGGSSVGFAFKIEAMDDIVSWLPLVGKAKQAIPFDWPTIGLTDLCVVASVTQGSASLVARMVFGGEPKLVAATIGRSGQKQPNAVDEKVDRRDPDKSEHSDNRGISLTQPSDARTTPAGPQSSSTPAPTDGTKWVNVRKTFGPLHLERVGLKYRDASVLVLLDGSLGFAGLTLSVIGLGFGSELKRFTPKGQLDGLGIDYRKGAVEIGGTFLHSRGYTSTGEEYDEY
ncbi:MAG: DUF6603 domain-containing protein, partial [Isosphaeraceae bacterium]